MRADELASIFSARRTGPSSWQACCPAHGDKSPSLSIGEADGKVLLHCFAGCDVADIVGAVGLTISDLFPEPTKFDRVFHHVPGRKWIPPRDVLRALEDSALVLLVASADVEAGEPLDREAVAKAAANIQAALEVM